MKLNKIPSKLFLPLIAVSIIVFLIFLPEIIGIKTIEKIDQPKLSTKKIEVQEKKSIPTETKPTSSTKIRSEEPMVQQSFEGLGVKIGRFLSKKTSGDSSQSVFSGNTKNKKSAPKVKYPKEQLESWELFQNPNVQAQIKRNLSAVDLVLTNVSVRFQSSRKELLKFKELLLSLYKKDPSAQSPKEIINKLEKQDLEVSNTLMNDLVPIKILELWSNVDLSSFYESSFPQRLKILPIATFNPRLQIHDATYYMIQQANSSEFKLSSIGINFVMLKKGVKEVKLFKNNILVSKLKLKKDKLNPNWISFNVEVKNGRDLYSVHVYGKDKQKYAKHYRFQSDFKSLSLSEKLVKKNTRLKLLYASAEDNSVDQLNMIDELYRVPDKGQSKNSPVPNIKDMEKF